MDKKEYALKKHEEWKGKIEVVATVPVDSREALSLIWLTEPGALAISGRYIVRMESITA